MQINRFGIVESSGPLKTDDFIRPKFLKVWTRTCKCGKKYDLHVPYELCNPDIRDLCEDCIFSPTAPAESVLYSEYTQSTRERERERESDPFCQPAQVKHA